MTAKTLKKQRITRESLNKSRLLELVNGLNKARVLVLGDLILDEYLLVKPERISREAPVIIYKYLDSNFKLGGAANAAANLTSLGVKTTLIGLSGDDAAAGSLETICLEQGISLINIRDKTRLTTTKTRIISNSSSNADAGTGVKQQIVRVDREDSRDISKEDTQLIFNQLEQTVSGIDSVLLSDYSNGVLSDSLIRYSIKLCNQQNIKSIVEFESVPTSLNCSTSGALYRIRQFTLNPTLKYLVVDSPYMLELVCSGAIL